jgi:YafQ family addiction module toxin component
MYKLEIKPSADKAFEKLAKKDREQLRRVNNKINEILINPYHFKPLRYPLAGCRRAHVGSFVITYEIDERNRIVAILDYDHHDNIYK